MPLHMSIVKDIGGGESVTINISQVNPITGAVEYTQPGEMKTVFDSALDMVEERMQDMVTRIMETAQLRQYCSPDEWDKIVSVIDIIAGRVEAHTVARRWHDKIEENETLAQGREQAAKERQEAFDWAVDFNERHVAQQAERDGLPIFLDADGNEITPNHPKYEYVATDSDPLALRPHPRQGREHAADVQAALQAQMDYITSLGGQDEAQQAHQLSQAQFKDLCNGTRTNAATPP